MTVKVCKISCNDVYMYILQCDIFWWKSIYRNFFNPIFNTKVVLKESPFFAVCNVLHVIISKQNIQICQIFHIYSTTALSSVLKPKYSLSIRNKCAYLLEFPKLVLPSGVKNTLKIAIFRMCYGENGTVKYFETLADNVFRHNYSMMQI